MGVEIDSRVRGWVEAVLGPGCRVLRTRPLAGGTTGRVLALDDVDGAGRPRRFVLKLYRPDPNEPDSAWREGHILSLAGASDLPVPRVVAMDRHGAETGWPALLLTRLPGRVIKRPSDRAPWLDALARLAVRVHELPVAEASLPRHRLWGLEDALPVPSWWRDAGVWREAVAIFRGPMPAEPHHFIHRDFHPANVLWRGHSVSGVVDWLHGCWGPPSADLAHCRLNLWLDNGPTAAEEFVEAYRALRPGIAPYNRYWDVADAMSWHLDPRRDGLRRARRWESFIAAAVKAG